MAERRLIVQFSHQYADRGLGRAVVVEHFEGRRQRADFTEQAWADGFAAQHQALPWQCRATGYQHGLQVGGHDLQGTHLVLRQVGCEAFGIQYLLAQ
ncbi:hypothetical protein D3C81_1816870 [compost metagenome]